MCLMFSVPAMDPSSTHEFRNSYTLIPPEKSGTAMTLPSELRCITMSPGSSRSCIGSPSLIQFSMSPCAWSINDQILFLFGTTTMEFPNGTSLTPSLTRRSPIYVTFVPSPVADSDTDPSSMTMHEPSVVHIEPYVTSHVDVKFTGSAVKDRFQFKYPASP